MLSSDGLGVNSDFQLFQSTYQAFGERSERVNYNLYYYHLHVP